MRRIAFISGTSIAKSTAFSGWKRLRVESRYGSVEFLQRDGLLAVNRHGFANPFPPHALNYRAYVSALSQLEVSEAVTLNSVGSLRPELPPGTAVSCGDYMSFAPMTFIDDCVSGFAPVIENRLLASIAARSSIPIEANKVYVQTRGPRFETRAEVRALQILQADVVGMTLANEADLLLESGIGVTSLAMIDNYAHGVEDHGLSMESFQAAVIEGQQKVDALISAAIQAMGEAC